MIASQEQTGAAGRARSRSWAVLAFAILLGGFVRLAHVLSYGFPLNDGGMFLTMTEDLLRSGLALPLYTTYNGLHIPFAYPPLPFYLAAIATRLTGASLLQVLRFLPALISILAIPAFYSFCRAILRSRIQATYAVLAFALVPRSFLWLIMGGGLTRAPGFLFAILMLREVYYLYTRDDKRRVLTTILWASLTVLSHPAGAWFAAFSVALLFLFLGRNGKGLTRSLLVAGGVLLVTAPWWVTIVLRHGVSPLLAASETGGYAWYSWVRLLTFDFLDESFIGLLSIVGLLGALACLAERQWLLPAWLVLIMVLDPRSGGTYATVPMAILVGIGLDRVVLSALEKQSEDRDSGESCGGAGKPEEPDVAPARRLRGALPKLVLAFFVLHASLSALSIGVMHQSALNVLPAEDQEAMAWLAENTGAQTKFLLLTGAQNWASDHVSEWFPTLAQRVSLATVQGYEWLPRTMFHRQIERYEALQACADRDVRSLQDWVAEGDASFTHIYLHEPRLTVSPGESRLLSFRLRGSLLASSDYRVIWERGGVTVFERVQAQR